jgi:NTP pyrophosphatase (non-canonical NTP hydrolase)
VTIVAEKINYEELINAYAQDQGMTFGEVLKFLAARESLECAASLLGVELSTKRSAVNREKLLQLGDILHHHGLAVPKLWDWGEEPYTPSRVAATEQPVVEAPRKKADKPKRRYRKMLQAQDITKERYLELRMSGLSRTEAMRKLELSPVTFYAYLRQWGIRDLSKEEQLLDSLRGGQAPAKLSAELEVAATTEKAESNTSSEQDCPQVVDKPLRKEVTVTLTLEERVIRAAFEAVIEDVHETAVAHGWHEEPTPLPVKLALIHSEVSEALEADRKHLGEDAVAEELADVVIRVMDTAAAHRLDLAGALFRKMAVNRQREYRHGNRKY